MVRSHADHAQQELLKLAEYASRTDIGKQILLRRLPHDSLRLTELDELPIVQVVPASLFRAVEQVVELQSRGMLAIPDSLPRSKLAEYAQLPQRQCLAQLTYTISAFTQVLSAASALPFLASPPFVASPPLLASRELGQMSFRNASCKGTPIRNR